MSGPLTDRVFLTALGGVFGVLAVATATVMAYRKGRPQADVSEVVL